MIFVFVIGGDYSVISTDYFPPDNPLTGRGDLRLRIGLCSGSPGSPGSAGRPIRLFAVRFRPESLDDFELLALGFPEVDDLAFPAGLRVEPPTARPTDLGATDDDA